MDKKKKGRLIYEIPLQEQMAKTFIIMVYNLGFYRGMDRKKAKNS